MRFLSLAARHKSNGETAEKERHCHMKMEGLRKRNGTMIRSVGEQERAAGEGTIRLFCFSHVQGDEAAVALVVVLLQEAVDHRHAIRVP